MESWLVTFAQRGLIEFNPTTDTLKILANPTDQQVEEATVLTPAGF